MYSNDYTQIKNGLTNYVGSMLNSCPFSGIKASRQYVAAALIEEALNLMKDDNGSMELYVAKPLLRGTKIVLEDRIKSLSVLPKAVVEEKIGSYVKVNETIDNLINSIKE